MRRAIPITPASTMALLHCVNGSHSKVTGSCGEQDGDTARRVGRFEARVVALEGDHRRAAVKQSWAHDVLDAEALYTKSEVAAMVTQLAGKISREYEGVKEEVVLVGLLDGVFMFLADLSREITIPHKVDFVSASSYLADTVSSGNVSIKKDVGSSVSGKHVLVVDEICDSGRTLACLADLMAARGAASVKLCVLLDKVTRRAVDVEPDFVGIVCRLPSVTLSSPREIRLNAQVQTNSWSAMAWTMAAAIDRYPSLACLGGTSMPAAPATKRRCTILADSFEVAEDSRTECKAKCHHATCAIVNIGAHLIRGSQAYD